MDEALFDAPRHPMWDPPSKGVDLERWQRGVLTTLAVQLRRFDGKPGYDQVRRYAADVYTAVLTVGLGPGQDRYVAGQLAQLRHGRVKHLQVLLSGTQDPRREENYRSNINLIRDMHHILTTALEDIP